ncbi:MAG: hypothetical protein WA989_04330, partial [Henriciella sp.]|uniref:hypothetical protein n=1 Tax=Henriciella sp. TaxID=1968823 RepID=UPI003C72DAE2
MQAQLKAGIPVIQISTFGLEVRDFPDFRRSYDASAERPAGGLQRQHPQFRPAAQVATAAIQDSKNGKTHTVHSLRFVSAPPMRDNVNFRCVCANDWFQANDPNLRTPLHGNSNCHHSGNWNVPLGSRSVLLQHLGYDRRPNCFCICYRLRAQQSTP